MHFPSPLRCNLFVPYFGWMLEVQAHLVKIGEKV